MVKSLAGRLDFVFSAGPTRQITHRSASLRTKEEWIASYSRYWNQQFDQLEKYLEGEER